jgi:hypothetical protein
VNERAEAAEGSISGHRSPSARTGISGRSVSGRIGAVGMIEGIIAPRIFPEAG